MKRLFNFRSWRDSTATVEGCGHQIIVPPEAHWTPDGCVIPHCPTCGPRPKRKKNNETATLGRHKTADG